MYKEIVKAYCEKTGTRYEEHFATSYCSIGNFDQGLANSAMADFSDYTIGLELGKDVWYWWSSYELDGYNKELSFKQRYSCRTGQKASGWKTEYAAESKIKDKCETSEGEHQSIANQR